MSNQVMHFNSFVQLLNNIDQNHYRKVHYAIESVVESVQMLFLSFHAVYFFREKKELCLMLASCSTNEILNIGAKTKENSP